MSSVGPNNKCEGCMSTWCDTSQHEVMQVASAAVSTPRALKIEWLRVFGTQNSLAGEGIGRRWRRGGRPESGIRHCSPRGGSACQELATHWAARGSAARAGVHAGLRHKRVTNDIRPNLQLLPNPAARPPWNPQTARQACAARVSASDLRNGLQIVRKKENTIYGRGCSSVSRELASKRRRRRA